MRSHSYHLRRADWLEIFVPPIVVVACLVAAAHLWRASGLVAEAPASDVDALILSNKLEAIQTTQHAELLLVGDSSCLMDVSARSLEEQLAPLRVYNLGTMRTLGLEKFGEFVGQYLQANNVARTVVLLIGPEMIAHNGAAERVEVKEVVPEDPEMRRRMQIHRAEGERLSQSVFLDPWSSALSALALPFLKDQVMRRILERPLKAEYGNQYGTPSGFRQYLRREKGSAIDPLQFEVSGSSNGTNRYAMSEEIKARCEAFRGSVPKSVRLFVGITPVPESNPSTEYIQSRGETLTKLADYLNADGKIELPATLPDQYFASVTHLNERGQRLFTRMLGKSLKAGLDPSRGAAPGRPEE